MLASFKSQIICSPLSFFVDPSLVVRTREPTQVEKETQNMGKKAHKVGRGSIPGQSGDNGVYNHPNNP